MYTHIYNTHIYIHMCTCINAYTHTCVYTRHTYVYIYMYISHAYIPICMHTCSYMHAYIHTHVHTHTEKHSSLSLRLPSHSI